MLNGCNVLRGGGGTGVRRLVKPNGGGHQARRVRWHQFHSDSWLRRALYKAKRQSFIDLNDVAFMFARHDLQSCRDLLVAMEALRLPDEETSWEVWCKGVNAVHL